MDERTRTRRNMIFFPLGTVGRDMVYNLVSNFLLTYVLFTRSLTAAQLAAITAIMVGARVFDALNDPIMGNIIERTRTRWGKFKPWMTIGILTTSLVVSFIFNTRLQGWAFIAAFGVFYFSFSITYTMHDISYWGMIPALGSNANDRNAFTSRATLFAGIGGAVAGVCIPMFTTGSMALGGNTTTAYGIISIVICILAPLFLAFTIFGVRENRDDQSKPADPISLKLIVKTITGNDQLMWIALCFLIQQVGNGIIIGGIGSTYIYFEFGYRGGLYSLFSTVGLLGSGVLMIFYPAISRRIHRKQLMRIMAVVSVIGYSLMLVPGLVLPANMTKFWLLTIGYMLSAFGQYGYYLIMMISILNTVEYNEYKTGKRAEAIISSLRPFLTKLGGALIVVITTLTYSLSGVTGYTNRISDLENAAAAGQITESAKLKAIDAVIAESTGSQTTALLVVMTVVSCVLMLLSYFIYRDHYKLDEETYDAIVQELEQRHVAQKSVEKESS